MSDNDPVKPVVFLGGSRDDLRAFPVQARRRMGVQLNRLQLGLTPLDFKPMPTVGQGVQELRVRDEAGAFRVIYLARRPEAVYILHAFQKKTQATARSDLDLARGRLKELTRSDR